jgi:hypothetical protein
MKTDNSSLGKGEGNEEGNSLPHGSNLFGRFNDGSPGRFGWEEKDISSFNEHGDSFLVCYPTRSSERGLQEERGHPLVC